MRCLRLALQCCDACKRYNVIPMVITIMQQYRDTLLPLLPWAIARRESGEAAASDCDIQFDQEPRISHYCVQVLANLACDDVPEPASAIPTFTVRPVCVRVCGVCVCVGGGGAGVVGVRFRGNSHPRAFWPHRGGPVLVDFESCSLFSSTPPHPCAPPRRRLLLPLSTPVFQNGQLGMYDNDGASGAVIRFVSAGGVEAVDALMNAYKTRPRVLEDALVRDPRPHPCNVHVHSLRCL
jgi:hypothetical protein